MGPSSKLLSLCTAVLDVVATSCLSEAFKRWLEAGVLAVRKKIRANDITALLSAVSLVSLFSEFGVLQLLKE